MNLTINGSTVEVFAGATVADAVRVWAVVRGDQVDLHRYRITDEDGLEVSDSGPAMEGMQLTVTECK